MSVCISMRHFSFSVFSLFWKHSFELGGQIRNNESLCNRTQLEGLKAASSDATFFMIIYLFLVCHSFSGIIYCKIYFPSFTISWNVCIVLLRLVPYTLALSHSHIHSIPACVYSYFATATADAVTYCRNYCFHCSFFEFFFSFTFIAVVVGAHFCYTALHAGLGIPGHLVYDSLKFNLNIHIYRSDDHFQF